MAHEKSSEGQYEELDSFDLFGKDNSPAADLSATVGAFKGRIQRKKKEKEKALTIAEKAARLRHRRMLEALVSIRRSLTEVARIDLGDRFFFELVSDDYNGWPRMSIRLRDEFDPDQEYPSFQVSAHDRNERGAIEICFGEDRKTEKVHLARVSELKRLPTVLKKGVREYLDAIGDLVLDVEKDDEEIEQMALRQKEDTSFHEQVEEAKNAISGDLFEESLQEDVFDTLPALDDELSSLEAPSLEGD